VAEGRRRVNVLWIVVTDLSAIYVNKTRRVACLFMPKPNARKLPSEAQEDRERWTNLSITVTVRESAPPKAADAPMFAPRPLVHDYTI